MLPRSSSQPTIARRSFSRLSRGSALAIALLAFPGVALADNECGAAPATAGTVTCTPSGNPYPNGITYIAPPAGLTIVLQDGVRVDTTGTFNIGVLAVGNIPLTLNGGTNTLITTTADGSFGALVSNNIDPISVTLDRIITRGANATGILASSSEGAITVRSNSITTSGASAEGISASTDTSAISVFSGRIATSGANATGIDANSDFGNIAITSSAITTTGAGTGFFGGGSLGILAQTGGNGTITVNSGSIDTRGAESIGIRAVTGNGAILVNSGPITTQGMNADGISVFARSAMATVNVGNITTTGTNADGIVATGATGANVTFGSITTTGANANGVLIPAGVMFFGPPASATVSVTGGNVSTSGATSDGVRAIAGTGTSTVNVSGNVSTQGNSSRSIFASGPQGASVTSGGLVTTAGLNSNGVEAASSTGPVTVTINSVSTAGNGSQAVLLNATAGNATATVNGALRTSGTTANALTVNSGGSGIVNVGAGASFSTVQGDFIRLTSTGTSTLNNAGTIGNNAGGFALVANGGPITINNTGTLTSDIVLSGGADVVNNSGTFVIGVNPDFGAGTDTFNNTGVVNLLAGATAPVAPVFTGLETFNNRGTIDLRNGRAGDTLTLPGSYVGTNGTLGLDITANGSTTTADRLIVGGAATGTTTITLNQLAGSVPTFNSGTVLVDAGAGSSATAFTIAGGGLDAGFVRFQTNFDAANNNFVLTGAPSDAAFRIINNGEMVRSLWLKSADAVSAQLRARRDALWALGGGDTAGRFWMQLHGSNEERKGLRDFNAFGQSRLTDIGYNQNFYGAQIGLDLSGASGEKGGFAFGLTGGYLNSEVDFGGVADRFDFDVANVGVYASYSSGNFFFNALGKYDYYWANTRIATAGFQQDFKGEVYGGRAEMGVRFGSDSVFIEPAASISYVNNDADDLTPLGTTIAFDEDEGLRGRIGGRIGGQFDSGSNKVSVYVGANYVHEFMGEDNVSFVSGGQTLTFTNDRLRDYGEVLAGLTITQNDVVSGFFEGNYSRSFSDQNGLRPFEGFGGRAGVRIKF